MTESASALANTPAPAGGSTAPAPAGDLFKPLDAAAMPATVEAWEIRRVNLIGNEQFRKAYLSNDISARQTMKQVFEHLDPKADTSSAEGREYNARQAALAPLKMVSGDLPAEFWDGIARKTPVTLAEREWALRTYTQCYADSAWCAKVRAGDRDARALKTRFNAIIASRVGSAEEVAKYREAGNKFLNGGAK